MAPDDLGRLAEKLAGLDRVVSEWRRSDEQARILFAEDLRGKLEKVNEFRGALADAQQNMIPRAEVKLLMDAVELRIDNLTETMSARLETVATTVAQLGQTLIALRSQLTGQTEGADDQIADVVRSRNLVFAVLGAVLVVIALGVTLYFGFRNHPTTPPATTTTTTTTTATGA